MPSYVDALRALYPNASFTDIVVAVDDGGHPYIQKWNQALGPKPSDADIAAVTDNQIAAAKQRAQDAQTATSIQALAGHSDPAIRALFWAVKALIGVINQTRQKTGDAPITMQALVKIVTDALAAQNAP